VSQIINHDEAQKRFVCQIDGMECSVDYEIKETAPGIIDIYRTFVHPDLRGKGIAESLLKAISEYAINKGFTVNPSCSYAVLYYKRHREHTAVLAKTANLENGGSCRLK